MADSGLPGGGVGDGRVGCQDRGAGRGFRRSRRQACRSQGSAITASGARKRGARERLFAELQPVKLRNCELARFGEKNDGGYLVCANLLKEVGSAYSYGISGYDGWGCDISTRFNVPVHQYDCFNTTRPSCPSGRPVFHAECVAGERSLDAEGRLFDSLQSQFGKNGDAEQHLVVKMDVEGAEWDSILKTPDEVLARIDQLVFEFHGVDRDTALYTAGRGQAEADVRDRPPAFQQLLVPRRRRSRSQPGLMK